MHQCIRHSCSGAKLSTTHQSCSLQVLQHTPCRAQHMPRNHVAAAAVTSAQADPSIAGEASTSRNSSSSSTALQIRRLQQPQHMWGDHMSAQQQPDYTTPQDQQQQTPRQANKPSKGFGGAKNSKNSGSSGAKQQQQQWVAVKLQDSCPCRSGLRHQDCCHPFLSGQSQPRSAPELARARITAALTGDVSYLASSTHPDSPLALGGSRDLARRCKKAATNFRDYKPVVVGMAHCRGDEEGTWLVLAILQETAGEFKGTKQPVMYLMAQNSSSSSSSSSSRRMQEPGGAWLYMGETTQFPQHQESEVLWQLVQQHCPEALRGDDSSSSSSSSSGMVNREVYFAWGMPALGLHTAPEAAAAAGAAAGSNGGSNDGSNGGWYLDLLQQAVQRMGSSSSSSAGVQAGSGGLGSSGGVVSMDAVREMRGGRHT